MWPLLFRWGDGALYSYTVTASLAFFVVLGVWYRETRRYGIPGDHIVNFTLFATLTGWMGSRLFYVALHWSRYASGELSLWRLWEGGVVFFGGFVPALLLLLWLFRRAQLDWRIGLNTLAPAMAFGHAMGRIGCFLNGCCHGRYCTFPWAVRYSDPLSAARPLHVPLHPSQLYEVLGLLALGAFLLWNNRRPQPRSPSYALYLLLYGFLRFGVEFTRGDEAERGVFGPLSTSQWIAAALVLCSLVLLHREQKRSS